MAGPVAAAVAVAVAVAACAAAGPDRSGPAGTEPAAPPSTGTTAIVPPEPPPSTDPPGQHAVKVYWTRDCAPPETATEIATCRIGLGELRSTPSPDLPRAALDELLAGPNPAERAAGLGTNIRRSVQLYSLRVDGDVAEVDLSRYFETAQTRPQVAQVVYTLTQFPGIRAVRFLVDHMTNGATGVPPVARADLGALTPTVFLDQPALHAGLPATFRAAGTAVATGEPLVVDLVGPDGATLATTTSGVVAPPGSRGPWGAVIAAPAGTSGEVTVLARDATGAEARQPVAVAGA